ncbi:MAG: N-acetylneuraminate synthase family protein [Spirochaetaceae bacterium]|jgi:sialic acid synthase SpsE|nr:N-acetylneuraminate synthase family protein [Spirochaetaceae bacterium]
MAYPFLLNGKTYTPRNALIIAELGTSHGGSLEKARRLIHAASSAGADCVKTQIVFADEILHPHTGFVPLPGGDVSLYDAFKSVERDLNFYRALKEEAVRHGLLFLAAPFGMRSAVMLFELGVDFVKIASPELNHIPLLRYVCSRRLPLLLSSGVSKLADIEAAVEIAEASAPRSSICLLHCVTAYPAPEEDCNVSLLENLSAVFGVSAGISDHSLDACLVPMLAIAHGACVIEKHLCLSREDGGLDDPVALDPASFASLCRTVRSASKHDSADIIAEARSRFGAERVRAALGDGVKRLARSERDNYLRTNRSIHAVCDIQEGEAFTESNTAVLRTEKALRPGLPPCFFEALLGRAARAAIPSGEGIRLQDI